jgi:hypothetical protein
MPSVIEQLTTPEPTAWVPDGVGVSMALRRRLNAPESLGPARRYPLNSNEIRV